MPKLLRDERYKRFYKERHMTPQGEASLTTQSLPTRIEVSYWLYKLWSIQPANNLFPKVFQLLYLISCTYQLNQSVLKEINPTPQIGRTDAEAEVPIFWPHDAKSQLIGKDLDAGKD